MARAKVQEAEVDENEDMDTAGDEQLPAGAMFENNEDGLLVDLSQVEEMKFELLPKGNYDVIIEDAEFSLSKSSSKPMWSLRLNVLNEEYKNRKLFSILSFSEKALPGTKSALLVISPELLNGPFRMNDPEVVSSIIGKFAKVRVAIEKSEGYDEQNRVKRWLQPSADSAFISG